MNEFELDVQQSISSIDVNAEGRLIVVGGRETLKIVSVDFKDEKPKMGIKHNLRRSGTKLAVGYVEFNKYENNLIVAASVQGAFSIFDVSSFHQICYEKLHTAAIHRVNWQDKNILISGGQDYLINIYDTRQSAIVKQFIRNDSIRDVKVNPLERNYFMAALDSGQLEYFDIRNTVEPVIIKQSAHNNLIICLDWNPEEKNVLASGSNEKEVKIWSIQNNDLVEKVKIQHIDGSSHLKWNPESSNQISVSSLNRDISVTTFDIYQPFRPLSQMKGHSDIITSFVYAPHNDAIITGSKDKLLKYQFKKNRYSVYDNCPRYPIALNQYNNLVFKLEDVDVREETKQRQQRHLSVDEFMDRPPIGSQSTTHNQPLSRYTISNFQGSSEKIQQTQEKENPFFQGYKNILNPRTLCMIQSIDAFIDDKEQQMSELDYMNYFQDNYDSTKDYEYNSNIAMRKNKPQIAHYWRALKHLIDEFTNLSQEVLNNNTVLIHSSVQLIKKSKDDSDEDQKSPKDVTSSTSRKQQQQDNQKSNQLDAHELQKLYKYFEKYPQALRQEIDSKNIILNDKNHLHIRFDRIPYYKNLLLTQVPINKLLMNKESLLRALSESIQSLIQNVIDQGDLASGFWMFAKAKNQVQFNNDIVEKWTQSYIELLLIFDQFSSTVKVVQECPNEKIRISNKMFSPYVCQKCMKESDRAVCSTCHVEPQCSICLKPVQGLYLWCQQCNHGGHQKELKEWFNKNKKCPTGCGHQCFVIF